MLIPVEQREQHRRWLFEITQIPTAAGREDRVIRWIERWCAQRPEVSLTRDAGGNLVLSFDHAAPHARAPGVWFTAHLDHPAFVVERVVSPTTLEMSFRGGVMDDYFAAARVNVYDDRDEPHPGTVRGKAGSNAFGTIWTIELDAPTERIVPADVGRWLLPAAEVIEGCIYTDACDDLSAVAAALSAFDVLRQARGLDTSGVHQDVRVLFTRAEEIGFIGAIAACREATIPAGTRVIALENSRSFPDSPIHAGPIVRVGDRVSVFSPSLTAAIAKRAEELGGPSTVTASQKLKPEDEGAFRWQRKLMAGGACEASVFYAFGHEATCVCLALGNYHNMGDLAAVQAGSNTSPPKPAREFVGLRDYDQLVELLVACGERLEAGGNVMGMIDRLWGDKASVLDS